MKMKLAAELKQFFFDRPAVLKKLKKKKLNALKKAGALSRRIIRNKPRRRKRKSLPGEAPSVHTKSKFATLRNVLFAYDPSTDGVVVGPVKIPTTDTEPAPATLEYGGRIDRRKKRSLGGSGEVEVDGRRIAADGSPRRVNRGRRGGGSSMSTVVDSDGEQRSVVYAKLRTEAQVRRANQINEELYGPTSKTPVIEPRPFVGPAMTEAAPAFPELYATSPAG
jgi:hypothetical protein